MNKMSVNDTPVEVSDGIFKIKIPIPFNAKYVNVYLIDAGVLSLIDVGPKTSDAFNALNEGLGKLGLSIKNVDRIVFTHRHVDHIGMGNEIKMLTNAETYIHESDAEAASNFYEEYDRFLESITTPILEAGVPAQVIDKVKNYYGIVKRICEPVEIEKTLRDSDTLNFGKVKLQVIHCPGHSPGSVCLYEDERRLLFTGDHILKEITPNPFVSGLNQKAPLKGYLDSLRKVENLDIAVDLPGHGDIIYDHASVITNLFKHHETRKKVILETLKDGPKTPYEVSKVVFGNLPTSEALLGLAEAGGHLEELLLEGKVELFRKGNFIYFRKAC
jgi:glyoxylase-like metal-dependent hydrolase (beta-lactamase superfamily II)